ncbi:MAG: universal stress protein [Rhodothermales bacterium]|nr:universal stress protein [Rhodothermales bacterium]
MDSFGRILVGTDFSDSSHAALRQAASLGQTCGAETHVAHVIDTLGENPLVEAYRVAINDRILIDALVQESSRLMKTFINRSGIDEGAVKSVQVRGPRPAHALVDYARKEEMDLIAVGTHGRSGLKRLLLGSVARAVVAESDIPVLVARERIGSDTDQPVQRILVPLDLSDNSVSGLRAAHKLATLFRAQLEIVNVLERFAFPVSLTTIKTLRDLVPDVEERVHQMVVDLVKDLRGPYIPHRIHVREGIPAPVILDFVNELGCDLIVMTKRGLSASERFVVGSTTEKVLQGASCSVYVEPPVSTPASAA